jgi:uncharacterized protein
MQLVRILDAITAVCIALSLCGCAERYYFYAPTKIVYATPEERGLKYEEVRFASADGTSLFGWFIPAKGERRGTIAYFHGNSKNISGHLRYVEWLPSHGYDVFLFDYRGYGNSDGFPSPKGVHEDCVAALTYLRQRPDVDKERIIVFGQSLGGSYALGSLANVSRRGIRAVVVEGAFASHREIADDKVSAYPLPVPLRQGLVNLLVNQTYDAITAIRQIDDVPVLLIHGKADEIVPYRHAQLLLAASDGHATLWTVPEGRHLDTFVYRTELWRRHLIQYLNVTNEAMHRTCSIHATTQKYREPSTGSKSSELPMRRFCE